MDFWDYLYDYSSELTRDRDGLEMLWALQDDVEKPDFLARFKSKVDGITERLRDSLIDNDICPDCGHKMEYKETYAATYYQPSEGYLRCEYCGFYKE